MSKLSDLWDNIKYYSPDVSLPEVSLPSSFVVVSIALCIFLILFIVFLVLAIVHNSVIYYVVMFNCFFISGLLGIIVRNRYIDNKLSESYHTIVQ